LSLELSPVKKCTYCASLCILALLALLAATTRVLAVPYQQTPLYRLNCGTDSDYTDGKGNVYKGDIDYDSGSSEGYGCYPNKAATDTDSTGDPIDNTEDDTLYQTIRWGDWTYKIDVAAFYGSESAQYDVTLKFAETFWNAAGKRKFRVWIQDYRVLDNFDIYAEAGGHDIAIDKTFENITCNDGTLVIRAEGQVDNPLICGIVVSSTSYMVGDVGMSDEDFVDMVEYNHAKWFIERVDSPYYLAPDWGRADDTASSGNVENCNIAGVGFQLAVYPIAVYRGWMTYDEAYNRTLGILNGIDQMPRTTVYDSNGGYAWRPHEVWRLDPATEHGSGPEHDVFDNGDLWIGVIFASEFWKGTEIEIKARQLYEETGWDWYDFRYGGYNEIINAYFLMAGHPDSSKRSINHAPSYNEWEPIENANRYDDTLFRYIWPWLWIDGRNITDGLGRNHYSYGPQWQVDNHRNDWISSWQSDPGQYNTYDWDIWGGDFCSIAGGFRNLMPGGDSFQNKDAGSFAPHAIPMCLPFRPSESLNAMKHMYWRYYLKGWPDGMYSMWHNYGFPNTYNIGSTSDGSSNYSWVGNSNYTYGQTVLGCENYRTGFVWNYMMRNEYIRAALDRMHFSGDYLDPPTDVAEGKNVVTSSNYEAGKEGDKAIDGKMYTRWESNWNDNEYIYIDLGSEQDVGTVELFWEDAYGEHYKIQVSNNATDWTDVEDITDGDGAVDRIYITPPASARYVKMQGITRATSYGYSLWAFRVFNDVLARPGFVDDFEEGPGNRLGGTLNTWTSGGGTISNNYDTANKQWGDKGYWITYGVDGSGKESGWYTTLKNYDARVHPYISFWIKGASGGEKVYAGLKDNVTSTEYKVSVSAYLPSGINTSWQEVIIPLSHFSGVDLSKLSNFSLSFNDSYGSPKSGTGKLWQEKKTEKLIYHGRRQETMGSTVLLQVTLSNIQLQQT